MHISSRFFIVCNIRTVIRMLKIYITVLQVLFLWEGVERAMFFRCTKCDSRAKAPEENCHPKLILALTLSQTLTGGNFPRAQLVVWTPLSTNKHFYHCCIKSISGYINSISYTILQHYPMYSF